MDIRDTVLAAIGNTPLIKLRRASEETGCTILGKAEFMNPGHSVKDRAALGIVTDAMDKGELRPAAVEVYPLASAREAFARSLEHRRHGKVVLAPADAS